MDDAIQDKSGADDYRSGPNSPDINGDPSPGHIPSLPSTKKKSSWAPLALKWWSTLPLGATFLIIAISSETVLIRSQRDTGFDIHLTDSNLSRGTQFIKSFLPSMIFAVLFLWFGLAYDSMRLMQPYISMANHGNEGAPAKDCILVDYSSKGPLEAIRTAWKNRHGIVMTLAWVALFNNVFSSLAGAYFQIVSVNQTISVPVTMSGNVGPNYNNLPVGYYLPYSSAAGGVYTSFQNGTYDYPAYAYDNLTEAWVVPPFNADSLANPNISSSGNLTIDTTAIRIVPSCAPVPTNAVNIITVNASEPYLSITGTLSSNCSAQVNISIPSANTWTGWVNTAPLACIQDIIPGYPEISTNTSNEFWPMAFYFIKNSSFTTMTFCYTNLEQHQTTAVLADSFYKTGLYDIHDLGDPSFLGPAPNGISYGVVGDFYTSVAVAIGYTLTEAIVRYAGAGALDNYANQAAQNAVLTDPVKAAAHTQAVYMLYQTMIAPYTLVVAPPVNTTGTFTFGTYRLEANPPAAHALTVLCGITGLLILAQFIRHHSERKAVFLATEPAGIATIAALVLNSGLAGKLHPDDDAKAIEDAVSPLHFILDPHDGIRVVKGA